MTEPKEELHWKVQVYDPIYWVAVKELQLSYHSSDTMLNISIYPHYGNLI